MRIVFIGASGFGLRCLQRVAGISGVEIAGVISNLPEFSISYRPQGVKNVLYEDFSTFTQTHQIPLYIMQEKMGEPALIKTLESWKPDFILVVGWYHMVPKKIRKMAMTAGLHASLLPKYSGGAPLVWAMINGENETGITFFIFEKGVDSGPIIGQQKVPILNDDTIKTLYQRIEEAGLDLLGQYIPQIMAKEVEFITQDESQRTLVPQRSPEDGQIDWHWKARRIYDFIRAQTHPYPGAFSYIQQEKVHIWSSVESHETDTIASPPGTIVAKEREKILVSCGDNSALEIPINAITFDHDRIQLIPNMRLVS